MKHSRYVLITPARNEAGFIKNTIEAIKRQTVTPQRWIIVDDGSTDDTAEIAKSSSHSCPWIDVVSLPDRGFRSVGAGSAAAFQAGLELLCDDKYEFIGNLDADIVVGPDYYQSLLDEFQKDRMLGIGVGSLYETHSGSTIQLRCQPEMAAGGAKVWRRECFDAIGGLVQHSAWDGIDCYKAMMNGWRTRTFVDPKLSISHLRPLCSSYDNVLQGWAQRGRGMWFLGATPLWVVASSVYHLRSRPFIAAAVAMLYGYAAAFISRTPKLGEPAVRTFIQNWQYSRLKELFRTK